MPLLPLKLAGSGQSASDSTHSASHMFLQMHHLPYFATQAHPISGTAPVDVSHACGDVYPELVVHGGGGRPVQGTGQNEARSDLDVCAPSHVGVAGAGLCRRGHCQRRPRTLRSGARQAARGAHAQDRRRVHEGRAILRLDGRHVSGKCYRWRSGFPSFSLLSMRRWRSMCEGLTPLLVTTSDLCAGTCCTGPSYIAFAYGCANVSQPRGVCDDIFLVLASTISPKPARADNYRTLPCASKHDVLQCLFNVVRCSLARARSLLRVDVKRSLIQKTVYQLMFTQAWSSSATRKAARDT